MEQIKKYIRGNSKRGHEVIAELEKLGGKNILILKGTQNDALYYISTSKHTVPNTIQAISEDTFTGQLLLTHPDWEEIELPKDKYPKTYAECCKILGIQSDWHLTLELDNPATIDLCVNREFNYVYKLEVFRKLLICRDAYCKIAGEEMGLGKLWERCDTKNKYIIRRVGDEILRSNNISCVLSFPTPEMRDAFYDNFIELIKECKELL